MLHDKAIEPTEYNVEVEFDVPIDDLTEDYADAMVQATQMYSGVAGRSDLGRVSVVMTVTAYDVYTALDSVRHLLATQLPPFPVVGLFVRTTADHDRFWAGIS
jgi:hypothetical protein